MRSLKDCCIPLICVLGISQQSKKRSKKKILCLYWIDSFMHAIEQRFFSFICSPTPFRILFEPFFLRIYITIYIFKFYVKASHDIAGFSNSNQMKSGDTCKNSIMLNVIYFQSFKNICNYFSLYSLIYLFDICLQKSNKTKKWFMIGISFPTIIYNFSLPQKIH